MNRVFSVISVLFSGLTLWVVYSANTGKSSVFFALSQMVPYGDKIGHFLLYGCLTLVINLALLCRTVRVGSFSIPFGSLLVVCFVILEELSQAIIPSRNFDLLDLSADFIGIALFTSLSWDITQRLLKIDG